MSKPDAALVGRLRGSVLLLGALLGRESAARSSRRQAATFRRGARSPRICCALAALGARVVDDASGHRVEAAAGGLTGASMYLVEASVTGTETALLAAAQAKGATEIRHAACEPHVGELCQFLRGHGRGRHGVGDVEPSASSRPAQLRGAAHTLRGDYIEAASWAVVGAMTGGEVEVTGAAAQDLEPIAAILEQMGVDMELDDGRFAVRPSNLVAARRIVTGLWPGFPSDIVSLVTVLATQARGRTLLHDWMYELRLFALEQLSSMRADLFLCDPHRIIVTGPTKLRGRVARQPRHPFRHGAGRRGARGGRGEHRARNRNGRAGLRQSGGAAGHARRSGRA